MEKYSALGHNTLITKAYYLEQTPNPDFDVIHAMYKDANMINVSRDNKIYRIFSYKRLLEALTKKNLCMVKPECWDDPFDNFLLRSKGILPDGTEVSLEPVRNKIYAQCWSTREDCDGLWRTYSKKVGKRRKTEDVSVKIETTVGKLFDELYDFSNHFHSLSYFVGKVNYLADSSLKHFLKKEILTDTSGMGQILALLVKRKAFRYENEIRIIFNDTISTGLATPALHFFNIDPSSLFDRITIEPWASANQKKRIKKELSKYYSGPIENSTLYDKPNLVIKL